MSGKGQNGTKSVKVDANSHLGKLTTNINAALKEHKGAKNETNKKHTRQKLAVAVGETMQFVARGMKEGVFKADPTGLLIARADFEDPVNEIAKEWLAKLQRANPDDEIGAANRLALQHAEASGIAKLWIMTKHGVKIVWNKIKGGVTFVYGKIKQFCKWVWDKVTSFWNWLKQKFVGFLGKAANDEEGADLKGIDMQAILNEGEESLANNYKGNDNAEEQASQQGPEGAQQLPVAA